MAVGTAIAIVTGRSQRVDMTLDGILVLDILFRFSDIDSIVARTPAFAAATLLVEAVGMQPLERRITRWRG